jgi:hypothetical protein
MKINMISTIAKAIIVLIFAIGMNTQAEARINRLPRFHVGVNMSTMSGPGLHVQADINRLISIKGVIGGYFEDYEPPGSSDIDRQFYDDLTDLYIIPGAELQFSIDRSDKRKLYAFYAFSFWDFSQIESFDLRVENDIPIRSYESKETISRNHSIGLGYEMIFDNGLVIQGSLGYQYQYSTGSGFGYLVDRSPDGNIDNGLGLGVAIAYTPD